MASKTNKTNKTNKTAKATNKTEKPNTMTYPQVRALTNALFHRNYTKAEMSAKIDKLLGDKAKNGMKPEAKAEWLKEHGKETATYGQCKMYAYTLFTGKAPYEQVSALIAKLDKDNGYVRTSTAKAVEKLNEQAKAEAPKASPKKSQPKGKKQANA